MTVSILPGTNHVFEGQTFATTEKTAFYTSESPGDQLLWLNVHNADTAAVKVTIAIFNAADNAEYVLNVHDVAAAASVEEVFPGLPLRTGDEIRITAAKIDVITVTAIISELISGDRT